GPAARRSYGRAPARQPRSRRRGSDVPPSSVALVGSGELAHQGVHHAAKPQSWGPDRKDAVGPGLPVQPLSEEHAHHDRYGQLDPEPRVAERPRGLHGAKLPACEKFRKQSQNRANLCGAWEYDVLTWSQNATQPVPHPPSRIPASRRRRAARAAHPRAFRFVRGPVFANIVLADEVNRTPPKTQAALLQAMQEHQVTAAGQTHPLPAPFFVLATQNPIEQEGTYPLPEAQLDRFMFELRVAYPTKEEEETIVEATTGDRATEIAPVLTAEDVLALQHLVRRIPVPKPLVRAAVTLVRMTRPGDAEAPAFVKEFVSWGAGPRASQYLILGAKARAALDGRPMPDEDDLRAVAPTVLTHRLVD